MWARAAGTILFLCFLIFGAMTAASQLIPFQRSSVPLAGELAETWRPDLARVRSVDDAMRVLPAYIDRQHGSREARVAAGIDQFVRERFYHGKSYISFHRNWLAWIAGAFWINLREPVMPDEILRHRSALCNQQAIVFQELLKRNNIHYASVLMGWPSSDPEGRGHFAVAAQIDRRWTYFDTDLEAARLNAPVERVIDGSALRVLYGDKPALLAQMQYAAAHNGISLAHIDQYPAPRGALFQILTEWLSSWAWLIFGLLAACFLIRPRVRAPEVIPLPYLGAQSPAS